MFQCFQYPQQLSDAPGLGEAASGGRGVCSVVDLRQEAHTALPQSRAQGPELPADPEPGLGGAAVDPQIGQIIGPQGEGPDGAL